MDKNVRLYYMLTNVPIIPGEEWRGVRGWDYLYAVSNLGRVRSFTRIKRHWRGGASLIKGLFLRQILRKGYLYVNLSSNNKRHTRPVHQLVGEAFVDNPDNNPILNHEDCNKLNNKASNLEWRTISYNTLHAYENGLTKKMYGEANPQAKLTDNQVLEIKKLLANRSISQKEIASRFNISRAMICLINKKVNWTTI